MRYLRTACLALTLGLPAVSACAAPLYSLVASLPLGGGIRWDYLAFDANHHWLYVSHGTEVTVVDLRGQKIIGQLAGLPGSHGIAINPATGDIWADSAQKGEAIAFSPETFKPLASVPVVEDADGMAYDPASKTIYVSGGDGHALTPINPATRKAYKDIALDGTPEFFLADGKGSLYVNIVDKNELVRIDTANRTIIARWPTIGCAEPTGLALDAEKRLLFASCRGGTMDVMNADTGAVLASFPIGKGTDAAGYDAVRHRAFSSNGQGTLTVIDDSTAPKLLGTVQTSPGARTMALDPASGDVLTVTATVIGIILSSTPNGHTHYSFAPGSMKLLIYAPAP
jgi:DNA-binding beta-propeller fold protein YncE